MAILIIEGEPGAVSDLIAELQYHNCLSEVAFYKVFNAHDLVTEDKWYEFLDEFKYLLDDFDFLHAH